ncbi:FG-GAP repeat domain-containing protein, partial [Verrucomicrobiota bacterium]
MRSFRTVFCAVLVYICVFVAVCAGTQAVPYNDFDADGKTDPVVYDEATGYWYILMSATWSTTYLKFGETGYTPVPADYDGDGKTDMAVYHEATGYWYILLSGSYSLSYLKFGETGYTPVPADYDGDG